MGETKKVGPTGRFGVRYGVGIRKKLLKVETLQIQKQKCPQCGAPALKRKSKGIFKCRKCSHEFVGGAYLPKTLTGGIIRQMVSQKKFVPEMIEKLTAVPIKGEGLQEVKEEAELKEEKKASKGSPVADTRKGEGKKEVKKEQSVDEMLKDVN